MRAAGPADIDGVAALYEGAGERIMGMSSIRPDREFLGRRLARSAASFSAPPPLVPEPRDYFFVLAEGPLVVGTSAIFSAVGLDEAFYSYRVGVTVHASRELGVYRRFETLHLSNDYTGATEVASLYVDQERARNGAGRLVSLARMLYLAEHPARFSERVIAEMRGFQFEDGSSPFWEGLGRHFFAMPFPEADRLSSAGNKEFIAELMPRHPIYTEFLTSAARSAIGQVHPSTEPALRLLTSEGFSHRGYIDIFDGGPTLEANVGALRPIRESEVLVVRPGIGRLDDRPLIVATRDPIDFRATVVDDARIGEGSIDPGDGALRSLGVVAGDTVRVTPLRPGSPAL